MTICNVALYIPNFHKKLTKFFTDTLIHNFSKFYLFIYKQKFLMFDNLKKLIR